MKAKLDPIEYHYRGRIERLTSGGWNGWRDGYSANGESGDALYPWMTEIECHEDAKRQGKRAVFRKGKS